MSTERTEADIIAEGNRVCGYAWGGSWPNNTCDCKYPLEGRPRTSEMTGCPELRDELRVLQQTGRISRPTQPPRRRMHVLTEEGKLVQEAAPLFQARLDALTGLDTDHVAYEWLERARRLGLVLDT